MERVPCLQKVGIQNVTCGPISYSPDVYPLLGPWPGCVPSNPANEILASFRPRWFCGSVAPVR
jgi:hypothetical protein